MLAQALAMVQPRTRITQIFTVLSIFISRICRDDPGPQIIPHGRRCSIAVRITLFVDTDGVRHLGRDMARRSRRPHSPLDILTFRRGLQIHIQVSYCCTFYAFSGVSNIYFGFRQVARLKAPTLFPLIHTLSQKITFPVNQYGDGSPFPILILHHLCSPTQLCSSKPRPCPTTAARLAPANSCMHRH
jgi:hypothetical protein